MDILYLLIAISIVFVIVIACLFSWSVKSGQYEDMEGPAHTILMDDDSISTSTPEHTITADGSDDERRGEAHEE